MERLPIEFAKHGATVIELNLAESIDNQEVTLNFRRDDEYRVLQRYRTSMSISARERFLIFTVGVTLIRRGYR